MHGCGQHGHAHRDCPSASYERDNAYPAARPAATLSSYSPALNFSRLRCVVDNGASPHCPAISSDFLDLTLLDDLGRVFTGIDCLIRGVGTVSITTINSSGKPTGLTLLNLLYVSDLPQRSGGNYLRLLNVRLGVSFGFHCTFSSPVGYLPLRPPRRPRPTPRSHMAPDYLRCRCFGYSRPRSSPMWPNR